MPADKVADEQFQKAAVVTGASEVAGTDGRVELATQLAGLDELVRFDPTRARQLAAELQAQAESLGDLEAAAAAMIFEAEAAYRQGYETQAAQLIDRSRGLGIVLPAELVVRGWWLLSVVEASLGDQPSALERAMDAVAALDDTVSRRLRARVLVQGANTLDELGARQDCLDWFDRAQEFAKGDEYLELLVANNRAYCALSAGDIADAGAQAQILRALTERDGQLPHAPVLDTLARIHLLRGDPAAAEDCARRAVHAVQLSDDKQADSLPENLITLAVAQRSMGRPQAAASTLDRAAALCQANMYARVKVLILQERAEVLAALGDYQGALVQHQAFVAADRELIFEQNEARARARQAVLETLTAREEAARYREEARHDALTGLYNRLHLEERLPELLADGADGAGGAGAEVLIVALLDLDHFKSINDTYSHSAGDQVLRAVARLLEAALRNRQVAPAAAAASFCARLGGEELVLVLRDAGIDEALATVERVRKEVEHFGWEGITPGRGLTLSGGVAVAGPDDTRSTILSRADVRLYEAKTMGRNRICADRCDSPVFDAV